MSEYPDCFCPEVPMVIDPIVNSSIARPPQLDHNISRLRNQPSRGVRWSTSCYIFGVETEHPAAVGGGPGTSEEEIIHEHPG